MYSWLVFLHVLFAFLFMLAHGIDAAAMWILRATTLPENVGPFMEKVPSPTMIRVLTALFGIPAIAAAIVGQVWQQFWIWGSLIVFVLVAIVMNRLGGSYFSLVEGAATRLIQAEREERGVVPAQRAYDAARAAQHPIVASVVGILGLVIILWMMRFKPA